MRSHRSLLRRASTALAAALAAVVLPLAAATADAAAAPAVVDVPLTCTALGQQVDQATSISVDVPPSASPGSSITVTALPTEQLLAARQTKPIDVVVRNYAKIEVAYKVTGARVTRTTVSGGKNLGPGTVTAPSTAGGFTVKVPGPIPGGTTITTPTVKIDLEVTAPAGGKVVISPADPFYSLTPTVEIGGGLAVDTTCKATKPAVATATIPVASAPPVDVTAPVVAVSAPVQGASYAVGQQVAAAYSCADEAGGSGVASCVGTVAVGAKVDTATVGSKSFAVTAKDKAGNAATKTVTYTVAAAPPVDVTAPVVAVSAPVQGASYAVGQQVASAYSCADEAGGSGVASCVGTVAVGAKVDTATVGSKSFAVTAKDKAGNAATKTVTYTVAPVTPTQPIKLKVQACRVREGKTCTVTFSLSAPSPTPYAVTYRTRNGSAGAGYDFTGGKGTITFEPGETVRELAIATNTDVQCREGTEQFLVQFTGPEPGAKTHRVGATLVDTAPDLAATTKALLPLLPAFGKYAPQLSALLPQLHGSACQLPVIVPLLLDLMPVLKPYLARLVPLLPTLLPLLPIIAPLLDLPFTGWAIALIRPFLPSILGWILPIILG